MGLAFLKIKTGGAIAGLRTAALRWCAGALLCLLAATAPGATLIWNGGGTNNNWLTSTNWSGNTAPAAGDLLIFGGTLRLTTTNNFTANTAFNGLTFSTNAGAFILNGNAINLAGNVTNAATNLQTINLDLAMTGQRTFNTLGGNLLVGGVISGGFALTKLGTETLILTGANTWSGGTLISAGTLQIGNGGATGNLGSGNVTNNGTLVFNRTGSFTVANAISGSGSLTLSNASATLTLTASNTYAGGTTIGGGQIIVGNTNALGTGGLTLTGGTLELNDIEIVLANLSGTGGTINERNNNQAVTLTVGTDNTSTTFGGTFDTAGGNANTSLRLSKTGTGTLTLQTGDNSSTRILMTVSNGVLRLDGINSLGGGNLVLAGGVLGLGTNNFTRGIGTGIGSVQFTANGGFAAYNGDRTVNLGGASAALTWVGTAGFLGNGATLILGAADATGTLTFQNPVGLNGAARTVQVNDGSAAIDASLAGALSGTGASGLIKTGTGALLLAGTNAYAGATVISNGTLIVTNLANGGANSALGASSSAANNLVISGGTLRYSGGAATIDRLFSVGTNDGVIEASGTGALALTNRGAVGFNGQSGSRTLVLAGTNTGSNVFAATLGDNGGASVLIKAGSGMWVLAGTNTYTGQTLIAGGTLLLATNAPSGAAGALGNATSAVLLGATSGNTNAALLLTAGVTNSRNVTVQSGSTGTLTIGLTNGGSARMTGSVTLNRSVNLEADTGGSIDFGGNLSGAGGITKTGAGTVTLSQANSFTGGVTVNDGLLRNGINNALPTGAFVNVTNSGRYDLGGFTQTIAGLNGDGAVTNSTGTGALTVNTTSNSAFTGTLAGSFNLFITGLATQTLAGAAANTFNGSVTINGGTLSVAKDNALGSISSLLVTNGGTLLLGGSGTNRVNNASPVTLGGGAIRTGGNTETFGALTLTASSTLDLDAGSSVIRFADSSGQLWFTGAMLTVEDWNGFLGGGGPDRVIFGTSASGLTAAQIKQVQFLDPAGFAPGLYGAMILANGEIVPVPEPASVVAMGALAGLACWHERRRLRLLERAWLFLMICERHPTRVRNCVLGLFALMALAIAAKVG